MLFTNNTPPVGDYIIRESMYLFMPTSTYEITNEGFIDMTKKVGKKIEDWFHKFVAWLRRKISEFTNWLKRKRKGNIPEKPNTKPIDTKIKFKIDTEFKDIENDIKQNKSGIRAKLEGYKQEANAIIADGEIVDIKEYTRSVYAITIPVKLEVSNLFEIINEYATFIDKQTEYGDIIIKQLESGITGSRDENVIIGHLHALGVQLGEIIEPAGPGTVDVSIIDFLDLYNDRDFGMSIKNSMSEEAKFIDELLKSTEGLEEPFKSRILNQSRGVMQKITLMNQRLITSITTDMSREYINLMEVCVRLNDTIVKAANHNSAVLQAEYRLGECDRLLDTITYE